MTDTSPTDEPILLEDRNDGVVTLTLNRPKQLNALSVALRAEVVSTVKRLSEDVDCRVIIVTGNGRAFTAGVDLKEAGRSGFSLGTEGGDKLDAPDTDMASAFAACPHPIIMAINGFAITGGFELALMGDIILASSEAKFADTHARVGLMPVWGLSQKLPRIIGLARAKELSFTGNFLDAPTAEQWGLVNRVCAPEELLPAAQKLAADMTQVKPALLKKYKTVIDEGARMPLADALQMEIHVGNAHNSAVTPEAAESSRKSVMQRGREQKG